LKKIIFIDSTWNQTNKILTDERLQGRKNMFFGLFLSNFYFEKLQTYRKGERRVA
jgi:hypothetical protein